MHPVQDPHREIRSLDMIPEHLRARSRTEPARADEERTPARRRTLAIHSALLFLVLLALLPILNNGSVAAVDEAVYATQATSLANGSWTSPRVLPQVDRSGRFSFLGDSIIVGDKEIAYARQPAYPLALTPFAWVGGYSGMLLLSAFGTWLAAMAGALIARLIHPPASLVTLWLIGLGSPLLFDSFIVMAHSLAAGLAGTAMYGLLRSWGYGSSPGESQSFDPRWLILSIPSAMAVVLVRSEGAVVIGAMAAAGVLFSLRWQERRIRMSIPRFATSVAIGGSGVLAYVANMWWTSLITPGVGSGLGFDRSRDPLLQAWVSIIRPWSGDNRWASTTMTLALVFILLGSVSLRFLGNRPFIALAFLCSASIMALLHVFEEPQLITGLIPTVPVLLCGLLLLPRGQWMNRPAQVLLLTSAITVLMILWTSYGFGGATEWGGRFFHILIPLIAPVGVVGLLLSAGLLSKRNRVVFLSALVVLTLAMSASAARTLLSLRQDSRELVEQSVRFTRTLPAGSPLVVVELRPDGTSRIFWHEVRRGTPVLSGGNIATYNLLLQQLDFEGISTSGVVTTLDPHVFDTILHETQRKLTPGRPKWSVRKSVPLDDTGYSGLVVQRDA